MEETKPFEIAKQAVKIAFERVKANKGTYGIDEQSISDFELDLKNNLYKKGLLNEQHQNLCHYTHL